MQASCDVAFKYAHEREQFGRQIGTFQVASPSLLSPISASAEACIIYWPSVLPQLHWLIKPPIAMNQYSLAAVLVGSIDRRIMAIH